MNEKNKNKYDKYVVLLTFQNIRRYIFIFIKLLFAFDYSMFMRWKKGGFSSISSQSNPKSATYQPPKTKLFEPVRKEIKETILTENAPQPEPQTNTPGIKAEEKENIETPDIKPPIKKKKIKILKELILDTKIKEKDTVKLESLQEVNLLLNAVEIQQKETGTSTNIYLR